MPTYDLETVQLAAGFKAVAGVDEAGRGPLAGPVVAAAVILRAPLHAGLLDLDDSKRVKESRRLELAALVRQHAVAWSIAQASIAEIESLNILGATMLAMRRAVEALQPAADFVLIDGNKLPPLSAQAKAVVQGDRLSYSIAAASILAKTHRDALMAKMDQQWPQYGFARHKGYGTEAHRNALRAHGPCPEHRPSFLSFLSQTAMFPGKHD